MTTSTTRRRFARLLAPIAVLGLVAAACGSDDDGSDAEPSATDAGTTDTTAAGATTDTTEGGGDAEMADGPTIQVRGQDFSEAITIAEVYGQYLEAKGYPVEILTPAGFRTEALDGLENGDFNLIVDYIGGTQAAVAPDAAATADADEIVGIITEPLEALGATLLDYSPAVDGDAFVVRGDSDASTISDVADLDYVLGGSSQCPERPQCLIGLEDPDIYGITFASFVTLEFGRSSVRRWPTTRSTPSSGTPPPHRSPRRASRSSRTTRGCSPHRTSRRSSPPRCSRRTATSWPPTSTSSAR
jgi:osmoprotectant transport system substrate-binding protein